MTNFHFPVQKLTVTKEFDGEGSEETFVTDDETLWCEPVAAKFEEGILVQADAEIQVGDVLLVDHQSNT